MKKPETDDEFLDLFSALMEESLPEGLDEADEELRAAGMDPEVVGAEVEAHAATVLRRLAEDARTQSAAEREQFRQELEEIQLEGDWTEEELRSQITALVAQAGSTQGAPTIAAHFHKLKELATKSDLETMLRELMLLRKRSGPKER